MTMTPEFSRRVAKIMNTLVMRSRGLDFKFEFIKRIEKVDTFDNLGDEDRGLILSAEQELK